MEKLQKGQMVSVLVEEALGDLAVVSVKVGARMLRGVLLDANRRTAETVRTPSPAVTSPRVEDVLCCSKLKRVFPTVGKERLTDQHRFGEKRKRGRERTKKTRSQKDRGRISKRKLQHPQPHPPRPCSLGHGDREKTRESDSLQSKQHDQPLVHTRTTSSLLTTMMGSSDVGKENSLVSTLAGKEETARAQSLPSQFFESPTTFIKRRADGNVKIDTVQPPPTHTQPSAMPRVHYGVQTLTFPHTISHLPMPSLSLLSVAPQNSASQQQPMTVDLQKQVPSGNADSQKTPGIEENVSFRTSTHQSGRIPPPLSFSDETPPPPSVITPTDSNCSDQEKQQTPEFECLSSQPLIQDEVLKRETEVEAPTTQQLPDRETKPSGHEQQFEGADCHSHSMIDNKEGERDMGFGDNEMVKEKVIITNHKQLLEEERQNARLTDPLTNTTVGGQRCRRGKKRIGRRANIKLSMRKRRAVSSRENFQTEEDTALCEALWISKQEQKGEKKLKQPSPSTNSTISKQPTTNGKVKRLYGVPDLFYSPRPSRSRSNIVDDDCTPFKVNDVVWAKLADRPWWPAKVLAFIRDEASSRQTMLGVSVRWLGRPSNFTDVLPSALISPFVKDFLEHFLPNKTTNTYVRAIEEALHTSGYNPHQSMANANTEECPEELTDCRTTRV